MNESRWREIAGEDSGEEYAARFHALARSGADVHGEASFCAELIEPGARVLDAGCGTGRVAIRLAELGFSVVGTDLEDSMLRVAARTAPQVPWHAADLSTITRADLEDAGDFDLVVLAGNVVPLLADGALDQTATALARLLAPTGLLVAGFGLDEQHLPNGCPVTPLSDYDAACRSAGLGLRERYATWAGEPYAEPAGYAVSVHTAPAGSGT